MYIDINVNLLLKNYVNVRNLYYEVEIREHFDDKTSICT